VRYALQTLHYRMSIIVAAGGVARQEDSIQKSSCAPRFEIALRRHSGAEVEKLREIIFSFALTSAILADSRLFYTTLYLPHKNLKNLTIGQFGHRLSRVVSTMSCLGYL
jgi:hypothetical protein